MAAAISLQQSLFVGGGDFVAQMHQKAPKDRVYLASKRQHVQDANPWFQRGYSLADAINQAHAWSVIEAPDCYSVVNGFSWGKGSGRTVSAVHSINGLYVDFDRYNQPDLKNLAPFEFMGRVLDENPWLPVPTIFEDSGNGCWMFWLFDRPLLVNNPKTAKFNFMAQWQTLEDFLIAKLKPYGADPKCSDSARVVRISGTQNTKTMRLAQAWTNNHRYKFADLKSAINAEYRRDNPKREIVPAERSNKRPTAVPLNTGKVSKLFTLYSLAHTRMQDMRRLAHIRGGRLTEHRRMAIWIYATFAAQFCRLEDTLRAEVDDFIGQCIAQPEKYRQAINYESTVDRFRAEESMIAAGLSRREAREQLGREKSCYRLSSRYIIEQLAIDEQEQRQLKTIISKDEKQRRNTISKRSGRRLAGMQSRAEYLAGVQQRRQQRQLEAVKLRAEGLSVRAIAERLGLSVGNVHRCLIAQAQGCSKSVP